MKEIINIKETYVWLFLTMLTIASWLLADGYNPENPNTFKYITIGLMLLAFFKVRLVIMYFMEIATAPMPLRLLFEAWVTIVCAVIILFYLGYLS